MLDCCNKPSHDLGRQDYFLAMFGEMRQWLMERGVEEVLVACPNCHRVFEGYGQGLKVRTVYEALAGQGLTWPGVGPATLSVHDSCAVCQAPAVHQAVRRLADQAGLSLTEMPHHSPRTLCCGEGGGVGLLFPQLARTWVELRRQEAEGRTLLTYCAGCAGLLSRHLPTRHLLDLLFFPGATLAGSAPVSGPPWTYLNRLRLKWRLRRQVHALITRQRDFSPS